MRLAIASLTVLTGICIIPAQNAAAQALEVGARDLVDLDGVHTFDEVVVRSGGTLRFIGDTTLRILGDFLVEGSDPSDPDILSGVLLIDDGIQGTAGARGGDGNDGANGNDIVPDGQQGAPGGDGGDGTDATSNVNTVRINAAGDILIDGQVRSSRAPGGAGGSGGEGGFGGDGLNRQFSGIASGPGGDGGAGGSGGDGGDAGQPGGPLDLIFNAFGIIRFGLEANVSLPARDGSRGGSPDDGGDGGDGGDATLSSSFNGGDGARGNNGGHGGNGTDGVRGTDVYMMAPTIYLDNSFTHPVLGETLEFFMPGGNGGSSGSGGDGGDGGSGGQAGSFAGNGGRGGNGAAGGDGGDGGNGARGGNLNLRGDAVLLAGDRVGSQSGGNGRSGGSGGRGGDGGSGGFGGIDFAVRGPNGVDGSDGMDGADGADADDGAIDVALVSDASRSGVQNGGFSNGLAYFVELGDGTATVVPVNDDPALQMDVDIGALTLTQLVGTNGGGGLQVDLDYAFVTPVGTLEVLFNGNLILSITPAGVTSPEAAVSFTPGVPFNHVSAICPEPFFAPDIEFAELTLRLHPGSPATVQVDNLALQEVAVAIPGDIDGDGDVDRADINLILAARNQPAGGADDPRDLDGDGVITVLDARIAATQCTRPRCATA